MALAKSQPLRQHWPASTNTCTPPPRPLFTPSPLHVRTLNSAPSRLLAFSPPRLLDSELPLCHTIYYECDRTGYARVRYAQLPYLCSVQQGDDWAA
jgi:hypothetical protein